MVSSRVKLRVELRQPGRQRAPEPHERLLPLGIQLRRAVLVVDVHHHQQTGAVKPLDGRFEKLRPVFPYGAGRRIHDDLGRDAEANMLEADARHHLRLGVRNVILEVFRRLAPGKPKPQADVGARGQAFEPAGRDSRERRVGGTGPQGKRHATGDDCGGTKKFTAGEI